MNLRRSLLGAALASLLSATAWGQSAGRTDATSAIQNRSRTQTPVSSQEAHDQPVVEPQAVTVEPPQNLRSAYGKGQQPPAGDPIPVRRSYSPELQGSVLDGM